MIARLRRVAEIASVRSLPLRVRLDLATIPWQRRIRGRSAFALHFPSGQVFVDGQTLDIDRAQLLDIFRREPYATNYENATVVDIGAHKGYYAAYVVARGARRVHSFEPEAQNFSALARAAESAGDSSVWSVEQAAVGSEDGEGDLIVSASSWAHSLVSESDASRDATGREHVRILSAERVLRAAAHNGGRVIVKVNAEGAECEIVLGTPIEAWRMVDEVFVEHHAFARCSSEEITRHLQRAGFVSRGEQAGREYLDLAFTKA